MGLFMYKATGWGDAYPRYDAQNNKSTKTAAGWSQAKTGLSSFGQGDDMGVLPVQPGRRGRYQSPRPHQCGDLCRCYMWGKSTNQVSVIETDAVIPMKHALSQLVIRLKVSPEYHNDGNLTSAKLKSKAAKFGTSGTMNLNDNGRITFSPDIHGTLMDSQHDHSGTGEPVGGFRRRNLSHEPCRRGRSAWRWSSTGQPIPTPFPRSTGKRGKDTSIRSLCAPMMRKSEVRTDNP